MEEVERRVGTLIEGSIGSGEGEGGPTVAEDQEICLPTGRSPEACTTRKVDVW